MDQALPWKMSSAPSALPLGKEILLVTGVHSPCPKPVFLRKHPRASRLELPIYCVSRKRSPPPAAANLGLDSHGDTLPSVWRKEAPRSISGSGIGDIFFSFSVFILFL